MTTRRYRKIRVLLVHSTLHIGGAEEVSANLCRRIDKTKFDVSVVYLKEKGVVGDKIESEGVSVFGVSNKVKTKPDYFTSVKLRRLIKEKDFDLIHSHDTHALADSALCRLTLPGVRHVHTFHFGNYPHRGASERRIERLFWRVPDQLITVSGHQKDGLHLLYGIPKSRIKTLWNGVDVLPPTPCLPEIAQHHRDSRLIIGCVNTLIEQKGMFDLIRVAHSLKKRVGKKVFFVIAGGGPLQEDLQAEARAQGLADDVLFLGWVKNAPQSVIPYIDVFFQPSLWEAMSMVLLEAMALGRPIVATDVGETKNLFQNGKHGYIVKPMDIQAMVESLEKLVNSPVERKKIGDAAQLQYRECFTAQKMTDRYQQLYQTLLSRI